jgi:SAM-dependent methyltransferase
LSKMNVVDFYNARYRERGADAMRPYEAYPPILDYLGIAPPEARITCAPQLFLDVACGSGWLLKAASDRCLGTIGVDISSEAFKVSGSVSPASAVFCASAESMPFLDNEDFDYVTCLGSLEHFGSMEQALSEMRRVAKPYARFCFLVPNRNFVWYWFRRNKGTEQQQVVERLLSYPEWRSLFENNGFKVLKVKADHWPAKRKPWWIRAVWSLVPFYLDYTFVFVLSKAEA